ncbi:MAG: hypothetical protein NZ521_02970 [Flammeovirgaceae bacterium]|nr:hypothetical protein [Flammeovirgaceae bacterium]MDW8287077.1 hypothetical protein [Flammeovirgaceae bacterium]
MLNFLKSLFGVKVPNGVIRINDLHFVSCFYENRVLLITWNNFFKKLTVSEVKVEETKKIYKRTAFDLTQYGHLELTNYVDDKVMKFTIQVKGGKIVLKPSDAESQKIKVDFVAIKQ